MFQTDPEPASSSGPPRAPYPFASLRSTVSTAGAVRTREAPDRTASILVVGNDATKRSMVSAALVERYRVLEAAEHVAALSSSALVDLVVLASQGRTASSRSAFARLQRTLVARGVPLLQVADGPAIPVGPEQAAEDGIDRLFGPFDADALRAWVSAQLRSVPTPTGDGGWLDVAGPELARASAGMEAALAAAGAFSWEWDRHNDALTLPLTPLLPLPVDVPTIGLTRAQVLALVHPDDRAHALNIHTVDQPGGANPGARLEFRIRGSAGTWRWLRVLVGGLEGEPGAQPDGAWGVVVDVTDERQQRVALEENSRIDRLTGLPSREVFEQRLRDQLADAYRGRTVVTVVCGELVGFDRLEAEHGRAVADQVLQLSGDRLSRLAGTSVSVARLRDAVFVMAVTSSAGDAGPEPRLDERLRAQLSVPFTVGAERLPLATRVAVVQTRPQELSTPAALLRAAEQEMEWASVLPLPTEDRSRPRRMPRRRSRTRRGARQS